MLIGIMSMLHVNGVRIVIIILLVHGRYGLIGSCRFLLGLILRRLRSRHGLLLGGVHLHLPREALLVLGRQGLVLLLLLGAESTPTLAHDVAHFGEFDIGILLGDFWTYHVGEEYVRSASALGSVGIPVLLLPSALSSGVLLEQIAIGIVTGRGDVGFHLGIKPDLVLRRALLPLRLFLRRQ